MPLPILSNEDARRLRAVLTREKRANSSPSEFPKERVGDNAPTPINWIRVRNIHATEAPAHAAMMPIRGSWIDGRPGFEVTQPTWDTRYSPLQGSRLEPAQYLINWERPIPPGKTGWGAIEGPVPVRLNATSFGVAGAPVLAANRDGGTLHWFEMISLRRTVNVMPQPFTLRYYEVGSSSLNSGGTTDNAFLVPQRNKWGLNYVEYTAATLASYHVSRVAYVACGPAWSKTSGGLNELFLHVQRRPPTAESYASRSWSNTSVAVGTGTKITGGSGESGRNEEAGASDDRTGVAIVVSPSGYYLCSLSVDATLSGAASFYLRSSAGTTALTVRGTGTIGTPVKQTMAATVVWPWSDGDQLDVYADVAGATATSVYINASISRLGS